MAKQSVATKQSPNFIARIVTFFQEVKTEMSKVVWPSVEELKSSTAIVLMLVFAMAAVVFVFDTVSSNFIVGLLRMLT